MQGWGQAGLWPVFTAYLGRVLWGLAMAEVTSVQSFCLGVSDIPHEFEASQNHRGPQNYSYERKQ